MKLHHTNSKGNDRIATQEKIYNIGLNLKPNSAELDLLIEAGGFCL